MKSIAASAPPALPARIAGPPRPPRVAALWLRLLYLHAADEREIRVRLRERSRRRCRAST